MITLILTQGLLSAYLFYRNWQLNKETKLIKENHSRLINNIDEIIDEINNKFTIIDKNFKAHDNNFKKHDTAINKINKLLSDLYDINFIKQVRDENIILDVDSILDKINKFGIESLTEIEKEFLNKHNK